MIKRVNVGRFGYNFRSPSSGLFPGWLNSDIVCDYMATLSIAELSRTSALLWGKFTFFLDGLLDRPSQKITILHRTLLVKAIGNYVLSVPREGVLSVPTSFWQSEAVRKDPRCRLYSLIRGIRQRYSVPKNLGKQLGMYLSQRRIFIHQ